MVFNLKSGGESRYLIPYACRFNDNDSAHTAWLTPGAATSNKVGTISVWIKRANLGLNARIFSVGETANDSDLAELYCTSSDKIRFRNRVSGTFNIDVEPSATLRDPTAWYHIVVAWDTTEATQANGVKFWINGEAVTAFDVTTYTQDALVWYGTTGVDDFSIGRNGSLTKAGTYWDGYMAELHFIDGTQLAASDFGQTDGATGQWVPKAYSTASAAYGNRGFYLDFSNSADFGSDQSGNANDFTDSGLATNDQVTDTPTNNYPTFSPLIFTTANPFDYRNGNLEGYNNATQTSRLYSTIQIPSSGKWYAEFKLTGATPNAADYVGLSVAEETPTQEYRLYMQDANKNSDVGGDVAYGNAGSIAADDVVGMAIDMDNGALWFSRNNSWIDGDGSDSSATVLAEIEAGTTSSAAYTDIVSALPEVGWFIKAINNNTATLHGWTANFGQSGFAGAAPNGFKELNTDNLPVPTIRNPAKYFDTVLYTGTGAEHARTDLLFPPDLVWIKQRSAVATEHVITDSVRGATKELNSDTGSNDESTVAQGLKSFDALGFTLGTDNNYNESPDTYAAWCWKESAFAGFDIVTYTGAAGSGTAVPHNLGVVPELIIVKGRATTTSPAGWFVYHALNTTAPETDHLLLDTTAATVDDANSWDDTAPTSTNFTVGGVGGSGAGNLDVSGDTYVAYLFASVAGFSKFGRYEGNNNASGTFVFCDFRPAFVMCKNYDSTSNWVIWDSKRPGYNVTTQELNADSNVVESTNAPDVDFLSNGFKLRQTGNPNAANSYIFAAFAEAPYKYARAR